MENIIRGADGGWCMHIVTKKTKTEAVLPLSDEALALCGERGEGQVFKGLTKTILPLYLKDWIKSAGITKHITFHGFRHTYATLQLAAGTDLYTISKMLTHSNVGTTPGLCRCGERPQAQSIRTDYTQMKTDTYII